MMGATCRRTVLATSLIVLVASACGGEGSDIGPKLPRIPDESSKVLLLDDDNRGVVSGRVALPGASGLALTGRNGRGDFLASPRGRLVFDAIGSVGTANEGDQLADMSVALTVVGPDLPMPIHLPDLAAAPPAVVAAGVQGTDTVITSATGDSVITVGAGVDVSG